MEVGAVVQAPVVAARAKDRGKRSCVGGQHHGGIEPGQRLDERARLGLGDTQGGGVDGAAQSLVGGWHVGVLRCDLVAQVEYAEFSWT